MQNPYLPYPALIKEIVVENEARDLKSFRVVLEREEDRAAFSHLPGQFAELSLFGTGEAPFGIASSPTEEGGLLFTVKRTGTLTRELHDAEPGRRIGLRGPLGRSFPWERMEGKNLLIVSGGFAFTTLRSALVYILDDRNRRRFAELTAVYGVREPGEMLYKELLASLRGRPDLSLTLTVDRDPGSGWKGEVGVVPEVVRKLAPKPENAMALVCGPPIMIRYTIPVLLELGFGKEDIVLSLENRMKCGIGKCGRCNIGSRYVCLDGPVFSWAELEKLSVPGEF